MNIYGTYTEHIRNIYGTYTEHIWNIYGTYMENIWKIYGTYMEHIWKTGWWLWNHGMDYDFPIILGIIIGTIEFYDFPYVLGMSSSQLTIFFS